VVFIKRLMVESIGGNISVPATNNPMKNAKRKQMEIQISPPYFY